MRLLSALAALAVALLALLAPALWNAYPITFHDTGGYIAQFSEPVPANGRASPYGLFLLGLKLNLHFWPAIVAQSLIVIALIAETGRSLLALRGAGLALFTGAVTVLLVLVTGIAWYSAQLLPDILAPSAVLALFLLIEGRQRRGLAGQLGLGLVIAFAAATHTGTVALLLGLVLGTALVMALAALFRASRAWGRGRIGALGAGVLALALGALAVPVTNKIAFDQFRFTPGGDVFLFGRLVQDGIASRYLADHCPDATLKLCEYQAALYEPDGRQMGNDSFLWWGGSPLYKIGGWDEAGPELARITRDSLLLYPDLHLKAAWHSFARQIFLIGTGDGLNDTHWHTRWVFEKYFPEELAPFDAAFQRSGAIPFDSLDMVNIPVGLGAMALLPVIAGLFFALRLPGPARFAAFVGVALVGNAFICGVLSNPHDRYESRLVWLAVLAVVVAGLALVRRNKLTNNQFD